MNEGGSVRRIDSTRGKGERKLEQCSEFDRERGRLCDFVCACALSAS